MGRIDETKEFIPVRIAILTVSDSRTPENDTSGDTLVERLTKAGHTLADRGIVKDDRAVIADQLRAWIADPEVVAIVTTGGTIDSVGVDRLDLAAYLDHATRLEPGALVAGVAEELDGEDFEVVDALVARVATGDFATSARVIATARFDLLRAPATDWSAFKRVFVHLPLLELRRSGHEGLLAVNLRVGDAQLGPARRIVVTGGLGSVDPLLQRLADLSGSRVERAASREATGRGLAFLLAGRPAGWPQPVIEQRFEPAANPALRGRFERWLALMPEPGA